jgi:Zn-dependent membrane protease YugP
VIAAMHREETELQIKLAQLQMDVRLYSNILIGFIALAFSVIIGFEQIYFASRSNLLLLPIFLMPAVLLFALAYLANKIDHKKKEMQNLKKEYVW